jgi:hypothetical protein
MHVSGFLVDLYLGAGTTLVADRTLGGIPMYCGMVLARDFLMAQSVPLCATYTSGSLGFGTDRTIFLSVSRRSVTVPPGAIEEFRLR